MNHQPHIVRPSSSVPAAPFQQLSGTRTTPLQACMQQLKSRAKQDFASRFCSRPVCSDQVGFCILDSLRADFTVVCFSAMARNKSNKSRAHLLCQVSAVTMLSHYTDQNLCCVYACVLVGCAKHLKPVWQQVVASTNDSTNDCTLHSSEPLPCSVVALHSLSCTSWHFHLLSTFIKQLVKWSCAGQHVDSWPCLFGTVSRSCHVWPLFVLHLHAAAKLHPCPQL